VFQVDPGQAERLVGTLTGHEGPVWQVAWAHPKFGSLLASCSYDGSVIIWKESASAAGGAVRQQQYQQQFNQQQQTTTQQWIKVKEHRLHESSVNALAWAPHELGLSLACASSDGQVSVLTYRVEDSTWEVQAFPAHQIGCNAVSWCPSPSADYLAALASGRNPNTTTPYLRLVTGGCDNLAKIWRRDESSSATWVLEAILEGHVDWVRDVAWSPSASGPIATCSQDRLVYLWTCSADGSSWSKQALSAEPFPDTLWRLSWSTAGNLLAVSCGDNTVSLWREGASGAVGAFEMVSKADQAAMAASQ